MFLALHFTKSHVSKPKTSFQSQTLPQFDGTSDETDVSTYSETSHENGHQVEHTEASTEISEDTHLSPETLTQCEVDVAVKDTACCEGACSHGNPVQMELEASPSLTRKLRKDMRHHHQRRKAKLAQLDGNNDTSSSEDDNLDDDDDDNNDDDDDKEDGEEEGEEEVSFKIIFKSKIHRHYSSACKTSLLATR